MSCASLVLLYHRVAQLERDPYGLAVHPDRFAQHCEVLRSKYEVVPLRDMKGDRQQIAITFDDGYADNSGDAGSILASAGLPATFFVTSGRVDEPGEMWWDRLEYDLLGTAPAVDHLEIDINGRSFWGDIRSPDARARVHMALYWRLRPLRPDLISTILTHVETALGVEAVNRTTHRWMNTEELRRLSEAPGIDVGAHTLTHPLLAGLSTSEQRVEIDGSRSHLERLLKRSVRLFSYPYGGHETFDDITTQLVRESGYALACTASGGLVHHVHDPYLIPRNAIGDWDVTTFEERLTRWFAH